MPAYLPRTEDAPHRTSALDHQVGAPKEGNMDPLTAYDLAKLRMAERHQEASRERLAKLARMSGSDDEHETSVWRRWTLRRVIGRITLATSGA
jgi:hypothetical protein